MGQLRGTAVNQPDLLRFLKAERNKALSFIVLATATTAARLKSTNRLDYMVNGKRATKAAADPLVTFAGLTNTAAGQKCIVVIHIDAAGTISFSQGPIDAIGDKLPQPQADKAVIGWVEVPASFTFDTTTTASLTSINEGDPHLQVNPVYGDGTSGGLES